MRQPTNTHPKKQLDTFYEKLQMMKDGVRRIDVCVVMGDFNAKAGDVEDRESGVGKIALGKFLQSQRIDINKLTVT